jgi:hypothetical protein
LIYLENDKFISDYDVLNQGNSARAFYENAINQSKYVLPLVRRLMPKGDGSSHRRTALSKMPSNSRSRHRGLNPPVG